MARASAVSTSAALTGAASYGLRIDVPAHHPGEAGKEKQGKSAPGCERAERKVTQVADDRRRIRHQRYRAQRGKQNRGGEKKGAESFPGHLAFERSSV
jgi:hypothetical protein